MLVSKHLKTLDTILSLITGGALWELLKSVVPEFKDRFDRYLQARKELYSHIDPILKASDELYGKILSLSKEDFNTFINPENSNSENVAQNKLYIYYLFAQFWAQLERFRIKNQYYSISRFKKGRQLLLFLETFESRSFRLLDRPVQRIIGELLIEHSTTNFNVMSLSQFSNYLESSESNIKLWISQLENKMMATSEKAERQRVLLYGTIMALLINHFDSKSKMIRKRKIYWNKLSINSKELMKNVLLKKYIHFISTSDFELKD